jgi:hypothetical protein
MIDANDFIQPNQNDNELLYAAVESGNLSSVQTILFDEQVNRIGIINAFLISTQSQKNHKMLPIIKALLGYPQTDAIAVNVAFISAVRRCKTGIVKTLLADKRITDDYVKQEYSYILDGNGDENFKDITLMLNQWLTEHLH